MPRLGLACSAMAILGNGRPNVDRLARKEDVEGLCRALRYRDAVTPRDGETVDIGLSIRRKAVAALRDVGDPAVNAAAREAVEDEDEQVALDAVELLSLRGADEELVDAVLRGRPERPGRVRAALREGVLGLGDPAAASLLAERYVADGGSAAPDEE